MVQHVKQEPCQEKKNTVQSRQNDEVIFPTMYPRELGVLQMVPSSLCSGSEYSCGPLCL